METAEGAEAETMGPADGVGTCAAEGGATGRAGGVITEADGAGGTITGRAPTIGGVTNAGGAGGAGLDSGGATVAGRVTATGGAATGFSAIGWATTGAAGRDAACTGAADGCPTSFFCVIARSTSPGREMFERSILVLISSSPPRGEREVDLPAEEEPSAEERMYTRTFSAS